MHAYGMHLWCEILFLTAVCWSSWIWSSFQVSATFLLRITVTHVQRTDRKWWERHASNSGFRGGCEEERKLMLRHVLGK